MTEININIGALDEKIVKLQTLKNDCDALSVWDVDVVGSGQSTELIKDIRCEYKVVRDAMSTLISNAIGFFCEVRKSAMSADDTSANKLSK